MEKRSHWQVMVDTTAWAIPQSMVHTPYFAVQKASLFTSSLCRLVNVTNKQYGNVKIKQEKTKAWQQKWFWFRKKVTEVIIGDWSNNSRLNHMIQLLSLIYNNFSTRQMKLVAVPIWSSLVTRMHFFIYLRLEWLSGLSFQIGIQPFQSGWELIAQKNARNWGNR